MTDVKLTTTESGIAEVQRKFGLMQKQVAGIATAFGALRGSVDNLGKSLIAVFGIHQITQFGKSLVDAQKHFQRAAFSLEAITGSAEGARKEFDFLRKETERLGLNFNQTLASYTRLAASTTEAGLSTEHLHIGFTGLAEAFAALQIPAEEVGRILIQMEQAMSIGVVQMEDLRAIAGALPGTFGLAQKSIEGTGKTLQETLRDGGIPAERFFKRFTQLLHEKYGPSAEKTAQGLTSSLNRLQNAFDTLLLEASKGTFLNNFIDSVKDLTKLLKDKSVIQGIDGIATAMGKFLTITTKAVGVVGRLGTAIGEFFAKQAGYLTAEDKLIGLQASLASLLFMHKRLVSTFGENDPRVKQIDKEIAKTKELIALQKSILDFGPGSSVVLPNKRVTASRIRTTPINLPEIEAAPRDYLTGGIEGIIAGSNQAANARYAQAELARMLEEQEKRAARLKETADAVGSGFAQAFEDAAFAGKNFGDVLKNLAEDLTRVILRQVVFNQIASAISGGISSIGGAHTGKGPGHTQIVPTGDDTYASIGFAHAKGGIVNTPTLFKAANGIGLMGEAGPEAIMPLTRTRTGQLGVAGGGGGVQVQVNVINNGQPLEHKSTRERKDSDGKYVIDLIVEESVNRLLNSGQLDAPLAANMGIRRQGRF